MLQSMGSQRAGHDLRLNSYSNAFIFSSKNLTEDQTQDFLGPSVVVLLPITSNEEESLAESWILDFNQWFLEAHPHSLTALVQRLLGGRQIYHML